MSGESPLNRRDHIARLVRTCRACLPAPRTGLHVGLVAGILVLGSESLQNAVADGDTRAITMHHLHTGEDITITYKVNGRYDDAALKKLDWFLRDWRENRSIHMDPHLIDLVWEVNREVEGKQPIQIVCGYRDESTNAMLRRRSTGVAQFSQHMLGKAMDFYVPGVSLEKVRVAGLRLQYGGVGYYPTSGSPFVHLDVGGVRHWPRMTREQLVRVFPDGRTVHIPSDGRPLPGYALALADIERHGGRPSSLSLATAERAGVVEDGERNPPGKSRSLLAAIFGTEDSDSEAEATAKPAAATKPARKLAKTVQVASAQIASAQVASAQAVSAPVESAQLAAQLASVPVPLPKVRPSAAPMTVIASLPVVRRPVHTAKVVMASAGPTAAEVIRTRFYWVGAPEAAPAGGQLVLASAETDTTGSLPPQFLNAPTAIAHQALAYAATPARPEPPRHSVVTRWAAAKTSIAGKAESARTVPSAPTYDPWLDAVTMTPSVRLYLSATQYGVREFASLRPLLDKPAAAVAMAFSQDAPPSLPTESFGGNAIVFIDTVTFAGNPPLKTASLP